MELAYFLVRFLTERGDLVLDPFGGTITAEESSQMKDVPNVRQQGVRVANCLTKAQARESWWSPTTRR